MAAAGGALRPPAVGAHSHPWLRPAGALHFLVGVFPAASTHPPTFVNVFWLFENNACVEFVGF